MVLTPLPLQEPVLPSSLKTFWILKRGIPEWLSEEPGSPFVYFFRLLEGTDETILADECPHPLLHWHFITD